ncbi:MAG TPA: OmpA family protein, partial [Rhodocyclaceae bacterium]|nr:OmpA family protein [Rhodocyclaceae bacterium]
MITNFAKKSALIALVATSLGMGTTLAQAQEQVYVRASGMVVKNATGLCWRTGYWTPAAAAKDPAGCECDKDLLPKDACGAPAATTPTAKKGLDGTPLGKKVTLAADALFDFDKAVLRADGKAKLDDLAASVNAMKLEVLLLVGHSDRIGSDDYNKVLSDK